MIGWNMVWTCVEDYIVDYKGGKLNITIQVWSYIILIKLGCEGGSRGYQWVSLFEAYSLDVAWGLGGGFQYHE